MRKRKMFRAVGVSPPVAQPPAGLRRAARRFRAPLRRLRVAANRPFRYTAEPHSPQVAAMSLKRFLLVRLGRVVSYPVRRQLARFEVACQNPQAVQDQLLSQILSTQKNTAFG